MISFDSKIKLVIYKILLQTIKFKRFFVQPPIYFEINYRTLTLILIPELITSIYIPYPFFIKKNNLLMVYIQLYGVGKLLFFSIK